MKIRNESINKNYLTPSIIFTLGIATVFGVGIYNATNIANTSNANALSYSTSNDISFTFAPTLSIGLSTDSLTIDNLVPGTTSDSNKVSVTVASNTPYGYVLSAGVGSVDPAAPYYNTSDLVHDNTTTEVPTANKFSSISTSASLANLTADNTWGYSTSTDGGTSWSTYSGLSHTETKPLLDISDPATPSTIDFKIAARSASTQASGTYNNVITFYAVGKPAPLYMQDTEAIKLQLKNTGDELQAIDQRDGKKYWVAKQADGNIWMTQNLDLCIGCDGTSALTSLNTDLNDSGSGGYRDGYTNNGGILTWNSTLNTSSNRINGTTPGGWVNKYSPDYPSSAEGGDMIIYTSNSNADDTVYYSLSECTSAGHSAENCMHYHVGNYYNWTAAVAMNRSNSLSTSDGATAANSICPYGWRLPKGKADRANTASSREFGQLYYSAGITSDLTTTSYMTDGFNMIRAAPLYFVRAGSITRGDYAASLVQRAKSGYYLSSSSTSSNAYFTYFSGNSINSAFGQSSGGRWEGYSVRCLVK